MSQKSEGDDVSPTLDVGPAPTPSLESLTPRSVRERRPPAKLHDYHLGTPELDSPTSMDDNQPQAVEDATATPESELVTQPSLHPPSPLLKASGETVKVVSPRLIAAKPPLSETCSQGESEDKEDDEEEEEDLSGDACSQTGKAIIPPKVEVPLNRTDPQAFQPGEFFIDPPLQGRPRDQRSRLSRSRRGSVHGSRTGSQRSGYSERSSVGSALSERLIQQLVDSQEHQRQDALAREEHQRQDALAREEHQRQDALAREEHLQQEARGDKERWERQAQATAEALQRAATENLELAKLALSRQPECTITGPISRTPTNASPPNPSRRDGEAPQVLSPRPQSTPVDEELELNERLDSLLDRHRQSPHPLPLSSPSKPERHYTGPYDPLPNHPPGSIVPFFTEERRENYREMRLSLDYLLGEPQAYHSEQQKWLTLHLHCKLPIAKRLCFSHAQSPTPYTDSIAELDRRWGCPWDHILDEVEALGELPDIRSDAALDDYTLRVRSLVTMLKLQGPTGTRELNTGSTVERFIRTLPRHREERFRRRHDQLYPDQPAASLEELSEFLIGEVKHIRLPKKAESKCGSHERSDRASWRREGSVRVMTTISEGKAAPHGERGGPKNGEKKKGDRTPPPPCPYCTEPHWLEHCPEFEKKNHEERKQWIKDNKRCWRCAREHMAKQCTLKRPCRIKECGRTHLTVLHDLNDRRDKPETRETTQDPSAETEEGRTYYVGPVRGYNSRVLLKMVPVVLRHDGKEMSTYAIIDDGAKRTLLLKEAANALGLKGRPHQMNILTIRPEPTKVAGEIVSLEIMARGRPGEVHPLCDVFTAADLSLSKYRYPIKALKAKYPHLSELELDQEEEVVLRQAHPPKTHPAGPERLSRCPRYSTGLDPPRPHQPEEY